jgi:hypothetical protein
LQQHVLLAYWVTFNTWIISIQVPGIDWLLSIGIISRIFTIISITGLANACPIFETLFTIWRRKVHQGKNPVLPDDAHFHSLIYRRLICWGEVHETKETVSYAKNAKTSPYL